MQLFLCCPVILNDPKYRLTIQRVKSRLTDVGYSVINPLDFYLDKSSVDALKAITSALAGCDAVAVYRGYRSSATCQYVLDIARQLQLPIKGVNLWEKYRQPVLVNWNVL